MNTVKAWALAALAVAPFACQASATEWKPTQPVQIIVPYATGGFADTLTRLLSMELTKSLGQNVIVMNKPGASGRIGLDAVTNAAPDGHTIGLATPGMLSILPETDPRYAGIDATYQPISLTVRAPSILVVNPKKVPAKTIAEFVELLKKPDNKLNYGSLGVGSSYHITIEALLSAVGGTATNIPYKGEAPALQDLVAGHVDFMSVTSSGQPLVESGAIRALATFMDTRWPLMPDLPTLKESGVNYSRTGWFGYVGPKGLPPAIVERYTTAIAAALRSEEGTKFVARNNVIPVASTPAEMRTSVAEEREEVRTLIKSGRIRLED